MFQRWGSDLVSCLSFPLRESLMPCLPPGALAEEKPMDRAEWFGQKGVRGCKEGALLGSLSWRGTCRSWGAGPTVGLLLNPESQKILLHVGGVSGG